MPGSPRAEAATSDASVPWPLTVATTSHQARFSNPSMPNATPDRALENPSAATRSDPNGQRGGLFPISKKIFSRESRQDRVPLPNSDDDGQKMQNLVAVFRF